MSRVDHDLSDAQWTALKAAWGGCAYCGASNTPLQRDCVLALSRGRRYTLGNIVPVCRSCNASKALAASRIAAPFHRLKGESLLTVSPPQAAEAEAAFATSIAVARRQGAKLLEDRATASLGRSQATRRAQSAR